MKTVEQHESMYEHELKPTILDWVMVVIVAVLSTLFLIPLIPLVFEFWLKALGVLK